MRTTILRAAVLAAVMAALPLAPVEAAGAPQAGVPYVKFGHAEWTRDATVYEINTRQFTREGTLRAAEKELPRLARLGVGILWLMPVHPIGEAKRKGSLGSPYAVRDFRAVNPELGTLQDLRSFVDSAHRLGMHVILDWVGNHTSWDNGLFARHPDWYARDRHGRPHSTPWYDWDDIIDLDYDQPGLRRYMADAMAYWVREAGVDGYRADAAGLVPLDFWEDTAAGLRAIKPVFLLAEWESRDLHARAFDASYAWSWWDTMKNIAQGKQDASALHQYYAWNEKFYPAEAYRLLGTSNHDKNAWEGTEFETFGPALEAAAVFSFVSSGMPMMYNGQEAGNQRRLAFFERDPIVWQASPWEALYRKLIALKKANRALWNGAAGGTMRQVRNGDEKRIFSFVRERGGQQVFAVFNLSAEKVEAGFAAPAGDEQHLGAYRDFADGAAVNVRPDTRFTMAPWSYRVLVR
jgi:glycosidase